MRHELISNFKQIVDVIEQARQRTFRKVNEELILMYWNVGKIVSEEINEAENKVDYVDLLAKYIQEECPGIKGFNRPGLYRMKQFYETYHGNKKFSPLVRNVSWTNNLLILSGTKSMEAKEFYLNLCIKENYSKRELQRQLDSAYYERAMLSNKMLLPEETESPSENPFKDSYVLEFLNLPDRFNETDLRKSLVSNMKQFILEIGKDFTFVGEEYRVQVGMEDYYLDLIFYHRGLACLVAFELKVGKFKPEYVSKMDFYLEALDRGMKKEHENPSVGVVLCSDKDDDVVEYAMSRTMSPMLISQYETALPDKRLLEEKMREYAMLALEAGEME